MSRGRKADDHDELPGEAQRLDKWLWHARFARTRTAAAGLIEAGHIRVNALRERTCARKVRAGDVLTIALARDIRVVRILECASRREGAPQAGLLYESLSGPAASFENTADDGSSATASLLAPWRQRR